MIVFIRSEAQKRAYYRGMGDYRRGVSICDCPYESDTGPLAEMAGTDLLPFYWSGGWMDAKREAHPEEDVIGWTTTGKITWAGFRPYAPAPPASRGGAVSGGAGREP